MSSIITLTIQEHHLDQAIDAQKRGKKGICPMTLALREIFSFNFKLGVNFLTFGNTGEIAVYIIPKNIADLNLSFLSRDYDRVRKLLPISFNLLEQGMISSFESLDFQQIEIPGVDTAHLIAVHKKTGETIGQIRWHGVVRQYCFYPETRRAMSRGYLLEISEKIKELMIEQRERTGDGLVESLDMMYKTPEAQDKRG